MKKYFEGYYYKHQKGENVLCIIAGKSNSGEFIQVITKDFSCNIPYIGDNIFSQKGFKLNIKTEELSLQGEISYENLTPLKYDIMGPFKYIPMQCRRGIVSMHHRLNGKVVLNGDVIDFTDGIGYIEKDSGRSFPSKYVWIQANDFSDKSSIMVSVAKIPFTGLYFRGCICVIIYEGREYRFATYLGAKIISCTKNEVILKQGRYKLTVKIKERPGHKLIAPNMGEMTRDIVESVSSTAEFSFYSKDKLIFHKTSNHTSFEFEA
ncbi:MAG: tocopherol cyclase family protein [Monoglobales bacterium]